MKKLQMLVLGGIFAAAMPLAAETETVGGYTWTYQINGDTAEICNYFSVAISPSPTGALTIPSTLGGKPVTSIGSYAFQNCSRLTSVTIPGSVTSIGNRAFFDCFSLTSVAIPDSVTSIGEWAFHNCYGLTSLTIPDSITNIGERAFSGCSGLTSVTIPNSVTSIGSQAFFGCSGLTSVTIGGSVTSIGYEAFSHCSGLTSVTIPGSVTSIGSRAFRGCSGLTSVTIPGSVTNIGGETFGYCSGLTSVTIPGSVTSIGNRAFFDCFSLTSVAIGNGVTSIGEWAFHNCYGLTSLTIPDSITSIGSGAFYCCTNLTGALTIPGNVTSIGVQAFCGCRGLTSVTIPGSVTSVGEEAFRACIGLTSVTIPGSVTSIGEEAFTGCPSWETVHVMKGDADRVRQLIRFSFIVPGYYYDKTADLAFVEDVPTRFTVTFYGGGKTLGTATVEYGKNTYQSAASAYKPTRAGYVLTGWYDKDGKILFDALGRAANGDYWNGSYSPGVSSATWKYAGNVTAYAHWTPAKYAVAFYGGGKTLGTATVEYGKNTYQAAASAYKPTRAGYVLTGWYDKDGNILFDALGRAANGDYWNGSYVKGTSSATWKYAGNVTAYANWTPVTSKYTVTFYGGGKTLGTATVEMGKNTYQAAASAYKPTRAGYVLTGWYDKDGKIMFDAQGRAANGEYWSGSYVKGSSSATWIHEGNVTAYANWTPVTSKYTVTFYGGGKTLGTATMEVGKNTNQAAASVHKPTRAGYVLTGWYDANDNILFDAQGRAVNGMYWNGSYVKGTSSATWKYAGNVTAYAHWAQNSNANAAARKVPGVAVQKDDDELFAPGELAGIFADGKGLFALTLDEGLETAYLVTWTADGGVTRECEATVADGTLVLTTEEGEVYRLTWDNGSLVATRVE